jgi:broad specificity phosphatase PhoE
MSFRAKVGPILFEDLSDIEPEPSWAGPQEGESWAEFEQRLWGDVASALEAVLPRTRIACDHEGCERAATGVSVRDWPEVDVLAKRVQRMDPPWAETRCHRHAFGYVVPFNELERDALWWLMHLERGKRDGAVQAVVWLLAERCLA